MEIDKSRIDRTRLGLDKVANTRGVSALEVLAILNDLNDHINNRNNPHQVTRRQLNFLNNGIEILGTVTDNENSNNSQILPSTTLTYKLKRSIDVINTVDLPNIINQLNSIRTEVATNYRTYYNNKQVTDNRLNTINQSLSAHWNRINDNATNINTLNNNYYTLRDDLHNTKLRLNTVAERIEEVNRSITRERLQVDNLPNSTTKSAGFDDNIPNIVGGSHGILSTQYYVNNKIASELSKFRPIPIGTIVAYGGTGAPTGWLVCDGSLLKISEYKELYDVLGLFYSRYHYDILGRVSNTKLSFDDDGEYFHKQGLFKVPDLRERYPKGSNTPNGYLGNGLAGGEPTHWLGLEEIPSHNHEIRFVSNKVFKFGDWDDYARMLAPYHSPGWYGDRNGFEVKTTTTSAIGGNQSHNNEPPYQKVNFIIYAGK